MDVPYAQLKIYCKDLLSAAGMSAADADIVAQILVATSLEGVDTHGVSRLPIYLSRILNGRMNPRAVPRITKTGPATAVVDGDNGLGQVVAVKSMETAIELARETGVACVTAKNSNHFGASSYYCEMAAAENMIGIAFTNTPSGIPPWGGRSAYFGTNPIAFAFPGDDIPIVVDMSSSVVARGNIIQAAKEGKAIPQGWAIDDTGMPTTDAKKALSGAVLPMAGAKGYAMALAVELFAGILSGAAVGPHVGWIYDDKLEPANIGHCFFAIQVERFMPVIDFMERANAMISEIKAVPLADGCDQILIPGERRKRNAEQREQRGVPVSQALADELNQFAAQWNVAPLRL